MSFLHTRDAGALVSRCQQCGHVIRARMDRDVFAEQRAHTWQSCQQRRAETARAAEAERATAALAAEAHCLNGHLRAGNTSIDNRGHVVCLACQRERYAARKKAVTPSFARVLATGWTKMGAEQDGPPGEETPDGPDAKPTRHNRMEDDT